MDRRSTARSLVVMTVMAIPLWAMPPAYAAHRCFGKPATIVGTSRSDTIRGTPGRDVIVGLDGTDEIYAERGKDRVCGGPGSDFQVDGGPGKDLIVGGGAGDGLYGGPGRDWIKGGTGHDILGGGGQLDLVAGGSGSDQFSGGTDIMLGQADGDFFNYGPGDTVINGGPGTDVVSYLGLATGITINLGTGSAMGTTPHSVVDIESVHGSNSNDRFIGGSADDVFLPFLGDDQMEGGPGQDLAVFVTSDFPPSDFVIDLAAGTATGAGSDTLTGMENVAGSQRDDVIRGNAENNLLAGGLGSDTLEGREGDDVLDGGPSGTEDVGSDTGDGGPHVSGDTCVDIEHPTNCESISARRPLSSR